MPDVREDALHFCFSSSDTPGSAEQQHRDLCLPLIHPDSITASAGMQGLLGQTCLLFPFIWSPEEQNQTQAGPGSLSAALSVTTCLRSSRSPIYLFCNKNRIKCIFFIIVIADSNFCKYKNCIEISQMKLVKLCETCFRNSSIVQWFQDVFWYRYRRTWLS